MDFARGESRFFQDGSRSSRMINPHYIQASKRRQATSPDFHDFGSESLWGPMGASGDILVKSGRAWGGFGGPRWSPDSPRWSQDGPGWSQDGAKMVQDEAKTDHEDRRKKQHNSNKKREGRSNTKEATREKEETTRKKQEERRKNQHETRKTKSSIYTNSRSTALCGPILSNVISI